MGSSGTLQFGHEILEAVVADARTGRHAGRDHHVPHVLRRILTVAVIRVLPFSSAKSVVTTETVSGKSSKISVKTSRLGGVISRYSP